MKISNKKLEKVAVKFTGIMIGRIKEIEKDWQKPWLAVKRKNFFPRNISGRHYSGGNALMLLFDLMVLDYRTPVFLTFRQANEMDVRIRRKAVSFPVYHISYMYCNNQTGEKITLKKYDELEDFEKMDFTMVITPKCYDVFNLDQTDFSEKYPDEWQCLLDYYASLPEECRADMYSNLMLDSVFAGQEWECPIYIKPSNRAYYSPVEDVVVLPLKKQFPDARSFYSTALHEITHSTGSGTRLKRLKDEAVKGSSAYAREELVAELSAALLSFYMGIEARVREDHASYLKHWLAEMDKNPAYLMDVLSDVVKAVKYICDRLGFNPFGTGCPATEKPESRMMEEIEVVA